MPPAEAAWATARDGGIKVLTLRQLGNRTQHGKHRRFVHTFPLHLVRRRHQRLCTLGLRPHLNTERVAFLRLRCTIGALTTPTRSVVAEHVPWPIGISPLLAALAFFDRCRVGKPTAGTPAGRHHSEDHIPARRPSSGTRSALPNPAEPNRKSTHGDPADHPDVPSSARCRGVTGHVTSDAARHPWPLFASIL